MKILIVEDDHKVAWSLQQGLREASYETDTARTVSEADACLENEAYDLAILDLGLPGGDGLDVLAKARARQAKLPFIVLTARDGIDDRVKGLDAGADDYIVKPFSFAELLARVRAQLRRAHAGTEDSLTVEDLEISIPAREVRRAGEEINLTLKEFDLLVYLAQAVGEVVSREMLARDVWKEQSRATPLDNVIDVHISHLRNKVDKGHDTKLIHTVRGVGFMLKASA